MIGSLQSEQAETKKSFIEDSGFFVRLFEEFHRELFLIRPDSFSIVAANHAARVNLGLSENQLASMTFLDIESQLDLDSLRQLTGRLTNGELKQVTYHTIHPRRDGSTTPVELELQLVNQGRESLIMVLVRDLSHNYLIDGDPAEKEETLRAIIDDTHDAIVMLNSAGIITFWNVAAEKLFGYTREEALGSDLHKLLVPDKFVYEISRRAMQIFQTTGNGDAVGRTLELKTKTKSGQNLDVELSLSALKIKDDWHAVGIVRDISERKQGQRELENSRLKYLELSENAPIGILTCNREGVIDYVNSTTLEILGSHSLEETKKINLLTFPLLIEHGFSKGLEECMDRNISRTDELHYVSKWGKEVWLRIHLRPQVSRNSVVGALVIIDDISERKKLEQRLVHLSNTDALTDVYNRRYFIQKLEEAIRHADSAGGDFSIIMMDIDHFKEINDQLGHNSGDFVLKRMISEITGKIRRTDTLARWGGEEFMILLPDTPECQAVQVAEKIRKHLETIEYENVGKITASFGVAGYDPGDTVDSLVQKVDHRMYQAKSDGRNCVRNLKRCS